MPIESQTHLAISPHWVGEALELAPGRAVARLQTRTEMAADERGLVHGGFAFGLADYAAMLAVNDPHVVLGAAETRFLAPVRVGEVLTARAVVESEEGKKRLVKCSVSTDEREVLAATFTCFVLPRHVFDV
jgi:acyl-coenzyme A thioesterase PaaI-like protein